MRQIRASHVIVAGLAALAIAPAGELRAQESTHVRGEVTEISGDTVTMQTEAGETVDVAMAEDYTLVRYSAISIDDIAEGDYLSIPAQPGEDGSRTALSVNVFPEAMRGTGEGETDWDLSPESRMINATVGTLAEKSNGHTLTVTYNDDEQQVAVPDDVPITEFAPVSGRRLEVGDNAVLFAQREGDTLSANLAGISEDGSLPPI